MTKPQMIDAVAKLDRQLQVAAQPLTVGDTEIVSLSLDDNVFGGGLIRRLSGRYPRCGTARALRELQQRLAVSSGREAEALETVTHLLERKLAALARIRPQLQLRAMQIGSASGRERVGRAVRMTG